MKNEHIKLVSFLFSDIFANGAFSYYPYPSYLSKNRKCYDEGGHTFQSRNVQVRFTSQQSKQLETAFLAHKYISNEQRRELANLLKLTERQIKTWFQNRRAKWRRIKLEEKLKLRAEIKSNVN